MHEWIFDFDSVKWQQPPSPTYCLPTPLARGQEAHPRYSLRSTLKPARLQDSSAAPASPIKFCLHGGGRDGGGNVGWRARSELEARARDRRPPSPPLGSTSSAVIAAIILETAFFVIITIEFIHHWICGRRGGTGLPSLYRHHPAPPLVCVNNHANARHHSAGQVWCSTAGAPLEIVLSTLLLFIYILHVKEFYFQEMELNSYEIHHHWSHNK